MVENKAVAFLAELRRDAKGRQCRRRPLFPFPLPHGVEVGITDEMDHDAIDSWVSKTRILLPIAGSRLFVSLLRLFTLSSLSFLLNPAMLTTQA